MSRITKVQKYAIQWLNHAGKSVEEISKELDIKPSQISTIISVNSQPEPTTVTHQLAKTKDLMITHTSGKKSNSVAIMTKEASEIADEAKKKAPITKGRDSERGIFRPKK
jgi:hypothetical protein